MFFISEDHVNRARILMVTKELPSTDVISAVVSLSGDLHKSEV